MKNVLPSVITSIIQFCLSIGNFPFNLLRLIFLAGFDPKKKIFIASILLHLVAGKLDFRLHYQNLDFKENCAFQ